MVYQFQQGITRPGNMTAQELGETFEKITQKHGALTPENVVEEATSKNHVLHPFFQWNDKIAAEAYRTNQARQMIRSVYVVMEPSQPATRAFVSVSVTEGQREYLDIKTVLSNQQTTEQLLANAKRELDFFHNKYKTLVNIGELYYEKLIDARVQLGIPA